MIRAACKQFGVAVLVVAASVLGVRADAANAFLPASANPSSTALHNARVGAPKERLVRIARGELGDGYGKWRLRVESDVPLVVMSLVESRDGHLVNVSTGTAE